jgi:hypothetical protein
MHKYRQTAIEHLGGKCIKCGFDDPRALEIDHIKGDGKSWRKVGDKNAKRLMENILAAPVGETYQLLCCNCHRIKTLENGDMRRETDPLVKQRLVARGRALAEVVAKNPRLARSIFKNG